MFDDQSCPSADELKEMLLGQLAGARMEAVATHVDRCSGCLAAIDGLTIESPILDALKARPKKRSVVPPDLERLMLTLDTLHPGACGDTSSSRLDRDDFPTLIRSDNPDELGCLAHFRMLEFLGAGGMGVVYRAMDTKLQRSVALKVLRPRIAPGSRCVRRFLREARAVASIKHDHVVVVYEVGEAKAADGDPAIPYIAMELLDGVDLQTWMREHPQPSVRTIVHLGRQAAEAVAALHARGLIHRDVKPANLWLEKPRVGEDVSPEAADFGRLKLLDFGLAATSSDAIAEFRAFGTPAYMSPEQERGDSVDVRSDLFGLGSVLYELCTGEHPFPVRRFSTHRTAPLLAHDINANVPVALSDLIDRMMRENPEERPDSARRIVRELTDIEKTSAGADRDSPAAQPQTAGFRARLVGSAIVAGLFLSAVVAVAVQAIRQTPQQDVRVKKVAVEEAWFTEIRKLPAKSQCVVVVSKLELLNPGYDRKKASGVIESESVIRFMDRTETLRDIRPLGCLNDLRTVVLKGTEPTTGQLADLSPLRLMRLHRLVVSGNPHLRDLTPLRGMPLRYLDVSDTAVASLDDLAESPLLELRSARTSVRNLAVIRSLPTLRLLDITDTPVESIKALTGSSISELFLDYRPNRDAVVLKGLASLRKINGMLAEEFWRKHDSVK